MTDSQTPLLDGISDPSDLRGLPEGDLRQLADELRHATVAGCTDCQIVLGAVSGACASACLMSPCRIGLALLLAVLLLVC